MILAKRNSLSIIYKLGFMVRLMFIYVKLYLY